MLRLLKLRPLLSSASLRTLTLTPTTTTTTRSSSLPSTFPSPRPPYSPSAFPSSPPHLLLQRLPVSGTPKGKARLKNITALKKKSFRKNKKSSSSTVSPFDPRSRIPPRPLIRRLNAKLRHREAIRMELGLESTLHKRDLEVQRSRENPSGRPIMGIEGMDPVSLGYVDSPSTFELTVDDGRRLAKEYSRVMMRWNRLRQIAEVEAIELMRQAVEAMPDILRKKALVPAKRKRRRKEAVVDAKGKGVSGKRGIKVTSGKKPAKKK